jgi:hypothetical protein
MAQKKDTRYIDGLECETSQLPARRSLKLMAKLLKALGPALVPIAMGGGMKADASTLGPALSSLDADAIEPLLCEILAGTVVNVNGVRVQLDSPPKLDLVFDGALMTMFKVAGFALEVNFGDFFDGASSAKPAIEATKPANH